MTKKHSPGFLAMANEAKQHIQEIDIQTVNKMIQNNESFYLLDVREDHEWEKDHLPKALHLCKGVIERDIENMINNKDAKIVLYCGGGYRSALAAASIQKMGYRYVLSMDGGIRSWRKAGLQVVKD